MLAPYGPTQHRQGCRHTLHDRLHFRHPVPPSQSRITSRYHLHMHRASRGRGKSRSSRSRSRKMMMVIMMTRRRRRRRRRRRPDTVSLSHDLPPPPTPPRLRRLPGRLEKAKRGTNVEVLALTPLFPAPTNHSPAYMCVRTPTLPPPCPLLAHPPPPPPPPHTRCMPRRSKAVGESIRRVLPRSVQACSLTPPIPPHQEC